MTTSSHPALSPAHLFFLKLGSDHISFFPLLECHQRFPLPGRCPNSLAASPFWGQHLGDFLGSSPSLYSSHSQAPRLPQVLGVPSQLGASVPTCFSPWNALPCALHYQANSDLAPGHRSEVPGPPQSSWTPEAAGSTNYTRPPPPADLVHLVLGPA